MAPVVLCLGAGIVLGDVLGVHWLAWLILLAGVLVAVSGKKHARAFVLGTLLLLIGWGNLLWHKEIFSPHDLRVLLDEEPRLVTISGVLAEAPRERFSETKKGRELRFSSLIEARRIQLNGAWVPVTGRIYVQTGAAPSAELYHGRAVQVSGVIGPPDTASAPGALDFRAYLARQRVYFQLYARNLDDWHLPGESVTPPLPVRFHRWAMNQLQGTLPEGDENLMLLQAMALGWKAGLMPEMAEPFTKSGTLHLFAISGLHVALIAVMLVELLRGGGVPRRTCGALLIPLVWFYTVATGWQASAVRSAIMITVIGAGWMLERPSNLLNSLAAAAALILVLDPQQLFQPGFQLSFMVVLSMALLLPPMEEWREKLFRPDPLLPEELRPSWQRRLDWPIRFLTTNAVTSFAAWIGSLPLIAYYFHMVTPVSLVANLLLVPLSSLALMSCFGSWLTFWIPPVSDLFNHASWLLMKWMVDSSEWFAGWPAAWWPVLEPGAAFFICFYALLFCLFAFGWKSLWRWRLAGLMGSVLVLLMAAGWRANREEVRLTVLDVKGGDAHVFEGGRHHKSMVIDAGGENGYQYTLKAFLQSRAFRNLPELLITHGDVRHVGGVPELIDDYPVARLVTSGVASRSPGYRQLLRDWKHSGRPHVVVTNGSTLGPWKVLHPAAADRFGSGDDNAMVLHGTLSGLSVLLLSDLGREGQRALLERHPDLRASIVVTGIPARGEPVMDELIRSLDPAVIIVTCADHPAMEQARPELRKRLRDGEWLTYFVSDVGSVTMKFDVKGCEIQTMRNTPLLRLKPKSGLDPVMQNATMD